MFSSLHGIMDLGWSTYLRKYYYSNLRLSTVKTHSQVTYLVTMDHTIDIWVIWCWYLPNNIMDEWFFTCTDQIPWNSRNNLMPEMYYIHCVCSPREICASGLNLEHIGVFVLVLMLLINRSFRSLLWFMICCVEARQILKLVIFFIKGIINNFEAML